MARRRKLTVFSRFLIVLVILLPLAFIGASLLNGEDPIENAENFWRQITGKEEPAVVEPVPAEPLPTETIPVDPPAGEVPDAVEQVVEQEPATGDAQLSTRIQQLEARQKVLEEKLEKQEQTIRWLESQVKSMQ